MVQNKFKAILHNVQYTYSLQVIGDKLNKLREPTVWVSFHDNNVREDSARTYNVERWQNQLQSVLQYTMSQGYKPTVNGHNRTQGGKTMDLVHYSEGPLFQKSIIYL